MWIEEKSRADITWLQRAKLRKKVLIDRSLSKEEKRKVMSGRKAEV